ncbi:MAG: ABC transporter substrate-binding protein [Coleofasciculus sp. S288]|nr:ABC transporter substrate-binding protein [Coleofasciculus sp. S288]
MRIRRRTFLQLSAGAIITTVAHSCAQSPQAGTSTNSNAKDPGKIQIGFWPVASGLPLFLAVEKGYFKEVGLDVEAVKFASPNQVAEALIAERLNGTGNGVATGVLALAEITSPGLFQIFASNPSNAKNVLEQVIVAKDSPIKTMADLRGKKFASGPGAQNKAIAEGILEKNGIANPKIIQIEIKQHVAAIESGQIDAAYTLEPTGTVGTMKGITRILESGVVAKYILGSPLAPWFGGSAALSTKFIGQYPEATKTYIEAYRRAIQDIRNDPDEARQYLEGYTAIEGELTQKVPLAAYTMYDEFKPDDLKYFQSFFDFLHGKNVMTKKLNVEPLLYKAI